MCSRPGRLSGACWGQSSYKIRQAEARGGSRPPPSEAAYHNRSRCAAASRPFSSTIVRSGTEYLLAIADLLFNVYYFIININLKCIILQRFLQRRKFFLQLQAYSVIINKLSANCTQLNTSKEVLQLHGKMSVLRQGRCLSAFRCLIPTGVPTVLGSPT